MTTTSPALPAKGSTITNVTVTATPGDMDSWSNPYDFHRSMIHKLRLHSGDVTYIWETSSHKAVEIYESWEEATIISAKVKWAKEYYGRKYVGILRPKFK